MLTNAPRGTSRLIPVSASVVSKRTPTCLARMTDVTAVKVPPWRLAPNYITDLPCGGSHPGPGSLKLIARAFGSEAFAQTHHPDLHPGGSRPDPGPEVRSSSTPSGWKTLNSPSGPSFRHGDSPPHRPGLELFAQAHVSDFGRRLAARTKIVTQAFVPPHPCTLCYRDDAHVWAPPSS